MINVPKKVTNRSRADMTEGEILEAIAKWNIGAGQVVKGKASAEFTDKFLESFDPAIRTNIEKGIEKLHGIQNFTRFRKELVMFLAVAMHNHTISGKPVNILELAHEANANAVASTRSNQRDKP